MMPTLEQPHCMHIIQNELPILEFFHLVSESMDHIHKTQIVQETIQQ